MTEDTQNARNRHARSQGIQVALAVSLYGISFGALAVALGFSVWQTMVLSLLMFSGASQFAFIGIVGTGGIAAAGAAIASAGLLGIRNGLYALRMSPLVGPGFWKRALAGHLTVDESTAVAVAQGDTESSRHGFWATALALYAGWNLATLVGALAGDALGDVRTWGLDAVAAAAFLGLLWPRVTAREPIGVAIAAAAVTIVLIPSVPAGIPVLAAAGVGILVAIYRHGVARGATSPGAGERLVTLWIALIAASLVVWALKNAGYIVPPRFVEGALMSRVAGLVTVALLASLVVSQTLQESGEIVWDARVPAVGVAGILLYFKTPFLLVLLVAGALAGGLRFFGLMV